MPTNPSSDNAVRLDNEKWEFEKSARSRELSIMEREQSCKEKEIDIKTREQDQGFWKNPLIIAVLAASVAAIGNAAVSFWNADSQREVEGLKAEAARILEMIKTGDPDKAADNLQFLVNAGLIKDTILKQSISSYLKGRKLGNGTALPAATLSKLTPPIIDNARIYLLSGIKSSDGAFGPLIKNLGAAGFTIVGAKFLNDSGRPELPEVRYFSLVDKEQAEIIAEFMRFSLNNQSFSAKQYKDTAIKPGYIEIWLGRK